VRRAPVIALGAWLCCGSADASAQQVDPCEYFYRALEAVPHDTLVRSSGEIVWLWDDTVTQGCEIGFAAHDSTRGMVSVPEFDALDGSEMHALGWRMTDGIGADGPGSGIFGIERNTVRCLVSWAQHAWIDDDGEFQQSEWLSMTVQCRVVARKSHEPSVGTDSAVTGMATSA
jgi:hypothetical protein